MENENEMLMSGGSEEQYLKNKPLHVTHIVSAQIFESCQPQSTSVIEIFFVHFLIKGHVRKRYIYLSSI